MDDVLKVKNYWFSPWMNLGYFSLQIENYSSRLRRAEESGLDTQKIQTKAQEEDQGFKV